MFKSQSDCIAVICGCNHSRHTSVFIIFFDAEFDLVELKWNSAGVRRPCPVLQFKLASLSICFFPIIFCPPFYHNECFQFIFPAALTRYVAALFLGWL